MNEAQFIGLGPDGQELYDKPPILDAETGYPLAGLIRSIYSSGGISRITLETNGLNPGLARELTRANYDGVITVDLNATEEEVGDAVAGGHIELSGVKIVDGKIITNAALKVIERRQNNQAA